MVLSWTHKECAMLMAVARQPGLVSPLCGCRRLAIQNRGGNWICSAALWMPNKKIKLQIISHMLMGLMTRGRASLSQMGARCDENSPLATPYPKIQTTLHNNRHAATYIFHKVPFVRTSVLWSYANRWLDHLIIIKYISCIRLPTGN